MTLITACPKPARAEKPRQKPWAERFREKIRAMSPAERQKHFGTRNRKPIARKSWLPRSTKPIPQINKRATERRQKAYRAHLASAYWREIRRQAFQRDQGLCWCPDCVQGRKDGVADAFEPIDAWFDTKGRPHGFDTHHVTYIRFGREELADVLTMKPAHHRALEVRTGIRKRFLRGTR